jgi:hypothetical protein
MCAWGSRRTTAPRGPSQCPWRVGLGAQRWLSGRFLEVVGRLTLAEESVPFSPSWPPWQPSPTRGRLASVPMRARRAGGNRHPRRCRYVDPPEPTRVIGAVLDASSAHQHDRSQPRARRPPHFGPCGVTRRVPRSRKAPTRRQLGDPAPRRGRPGAGPLPDRRHRALGERGASRSGDVCRAQATPRQLVSTRGPGIIRVRGRG